MALSWFAPGYKRPVNQDQPMPIERHSRILIHEIIRRKEGFAFGLGMVTGGNKEQ
jgi:hypothetical protein